MWDAVNDPQSWLVNGMVYYWILFGFPNYYQCHHHTKIAHDFFAYHLFMFFPPDTPHGQRSKDHLVNIISAPKNPTETKNHVTHTACIDLCLADVAFGPDTTDNDVHTNSPQTKTTRKCTNHTTCHRLLIVPSMWRYPSPNLQITMKKTYNYDPNPNFLGNSLVSRSNVSTL